MGVLRFPRDNTQNVVKIEICVRFEGEPRYAQTMTAYPVSTGASRDGARGAGPLRIIDGAKEGPVVYPGWEERIAEFSEIATRSWKWGEVHETKCAKAIREWVAFAGDQGWTPRVASRWANSMIHADRPGSSTTAKNKVSAVRVFCGEMVRLGYLESNPFIGHRIKCDTNRKGRSTVPFTLEEVRSLILAAEAREASTDKRQNRRGPLASTFYAFLMLTGARRREAGLQLRSDVDLERGVLTFSADKARRRDSIPIPPECVVAIQSWLAWCDEQIRSGNRKYVDRALYLFPECPSHMTLQRDMAACKIPGYEQGDEKEARGFWHRFRKAAVTERANRGADVRNLHHFARHENLETTLKIYDLAKVEDMRKVADSMPRLNGFMGKNESKVKKSVDKRQGDDDDVGACSYEASSHEESTEQSEPRPYRDGARAGTQRKNAAGDGSVCSEKSERFRVEAGARVPLPPLQREVEHTASLLESVTRAHQAYLDLVARLMRGASGGVARQQVPSHDQD